jgi:WD40 repeat protein
LTLPARSNVSQVRFSPDATKLAAGYVDGGMDVWTIPEGARSGSVEGRGAAIRSIVLVNDQIVSLDGLAFDIASPSGGGTAEGDTIRVWDLVSGQELQSWHGKELDPALTTIGTLAHVPNTSRFILRRENSPYLYEWRLGENTVSSFDSPTPYLNREVLFSRFGNRMATFGQNRDFQGQTIFLWDITQNDDRLDFDLHNEIPAIFTETEQRLHLIALHPTAPEIVGLTFDGYMSLWDGESGILKQSGALRWRRIPLGVTYNPDGTLLVVNGGFLRLFSADTLEEIDTLTGWDVVSYFGRLEFNRAGNLVTSIINSSGYGGGIALWDITDEVAPRILPAKATSILFSPDDRLLISAGYDGTIRFWGVPTSE